MKKAKREPWLKPRGYIHFTTKFDLKNLEQVKFISSYASDPASVIKHGFYPLIHRPIITRRYKPTHIESLGKKKRVHTYIDETGKKKSNAKIRHIYYSTHLDAYIYSYYCQKILTPKYEQKVLETPGLSDCISAYRKIPTVAGSKKNKNNIHFAKDVFDFIKNYGECVALTFDVSAFFDSLNQKYLKQQWCSLLNKKALPEDHHHIYKSLTRISYVEFYTVLKEYGIKSRYWFKNKKHINFCKDANEFRKRMKEKGYIETHPFLLDDAKLNDGDKMLSKYVGIPQGTPLSALLSNLYMLEFDKLLHEKMVNSLGGLYRRYSDDIVVVCKPEYALEIKNFVLDIIKNKFYLNINKDKVDTSIFTENERGLTCDKPLRYLGFEFDGKRTLIKATSLSKFYRNMKRAVATQVTKAKRGKYPVTSRIYKHDLYKQYSHLGSKKKGRKRNFYAYANDASKIMNEKAIMKQFSKAWKNLMKEIDKGEKELLEYRSKKVYIEKTNT